jgi:hypothetical protein
MATTLDRIRALSRNEVTRAMRTALRRRSGKAWSVKGGTGTAYGWIRIASPPARMEGWSMPEADREELARLLGIESVHPQGESVPASSEYRAEYLDRCEGRNPSVCGTVYWD